MARFTDCNDGAGYVEFTVLSTGEVLVTTGWRETLKGRYNRVENILSSKDARKAVKKLLEELDKAGV